MRTPIAPKHQNTKHHHLIWGGLGLSKARRGDESIKCDQLSSLTPAHSDTQAPPDLHSLINTALQNYRILSREVIPADRAVVAGRTKSQITKNIKQRSSGGPPWCADPRMKNCLSCRCPDQPNDPASKVYQKAARMLFSRLVTQVLSRRKAPGAEM